MSKKLISGQRAFTMLVPVYRGGSDPSRGVAGNPDVKRQTMRLQHFPEVGGRGPNTVAHEPSSPGVGTRVGLVSYTTDPLPVNATGTIEVTSNAFTGPTTVILGDFVLTTDVDFDIGGAATVTATNLAAAIDALPGYSAPAPGAAIVSVSGLRGVIGNHVVFKSGGSTPQNFDFTPTDGSMSGAEPAIGPIEIS
jgi:hypothetical protein